MTGGVGTRGGIGPGQSQPFEVAAGREDDAVLAGVGVGQGGGGARPDRADALAAVGGGDRVLRRPGEIEAGVVDAVRHARRQPPRERAERGRIDRETQRG